MAKPFIIVGGVRTEYDTVAEYEAALAIINAAVPPLAPDFQFILDNTKTTFFDDDAGGFVALKPKYVNAVCTSGASPVTIDVATFPVPDNILGKTWIEVYIVDTVSGNFGIAEVCVSWRKFTGAPAIGTVHPIIPLQTPGTLAGATLPALVVSGNNIISRFTGVANRTINVYVKYSPTVLKF